jgi:benzoyl-CoA reductase/2-hydroxyglutaryl-CoA dehydratase subunit BcrC/BadD/HgdB
MNQNEEFSGFIFTNACHAMDTVFEMIKEQMKDKPIFLLNVPRGFGESEVGFFEEELDRLFSWLNSEFSFSISNYDIKKEITFNNLLRKEIEQIKETITKREISLTAEEILKLNEWFFHNPREFIKESHELLSHHGNDDEVQKKPRVLLMGSVYSPLNIMKVIEDVGGQVVYSDNCNTFFNVDGAVDETDTPLHALAKYYLYHFQCARQYNSDQRTENILDIIRQFKIDAVVLSIVKFCPDQTYYTHVIIDALKRLGIQHIVLNEEYINECSAQYQTRLQAFFECCAVKGG